MAEKQQWGSRVGLILAMAGNAVGLGNFLRFPAQAVENGGGTFIIPYLVCFVLMGIPLLWVEWASGRFGGKFGHHSTPFILDSMAKKKLWKYMGVFGIFTNIGVAAYYCYIESWTLSYVMHSLMGTFQGMDQQGVSNFISTYTTIGKSTLGAGIPYEAVVFYILCLALNTFILSKGLEGVEKAAKIGVPLLLLFGLVLAIRGLTLGESGASADFPNASAWDGLNFFWSPPSELSSLWDPKVWLAAAGQIFFTLSVGMGTIHCYASYLDARRSDIGLNAVSAGFMNEFVEVVLGSLVVVPIAAGYLGIDWVKENVGFGMAFQTMPYLFNQWGDWLGRFAGLFWFGLLFFAGITSSLAMGTPWMGFVNDEFNWGRKKGAWTFGLIVLLMGLPTVFFFKYGVFDEYDYWVGTVSLVMLALAEIILFGWFFGIKKGWEEINRGAEIKVPIFFKFVIKYVTPLIIIVVFLGSIFAPRGGDWGSSLSRLFSGKGWELADNSIISKIGNEGLKRTIRQTKADLELKNAELKREEYHLEVNSSAIQNIGSLSFDDKESIDKLISDSEIIITSLKLELETLKENLRVAKGTATALTWARVYLLALFVFICILVRIAYVRRRKEKRLYYED
ncbi:MAG: hypothetical protein Kapaf2KO_15730 [Candidatus Kapaibacteriales bacterium]